MKKISIAIYVAAMYSPMIFAQNIIDANVTLQLLNEDKSPAIGLTYSGECTSKKEDSYFSEKITTQFTCISDVNGICKFQYKTYKINDDNHSICVKSESPYILQNGIKSEAATGTWGGLPNRKPNIFASITKINNKWLHYTNGGKPERLPDKVMHGNVIYYISQSGFENSQQGTASFDVYYSNTKIKDDELETIATISTVNAHANPSKHFIRAFIDKKNKKTSYQLYVGDLYYDFSFRNYMQAKYISLNEPRQIPVVKIAQNVDCSNKMEGKCRYSESVGFDLEDELFRQILEKFKNEPNGVWKYRISSSSGFDLNASLALSEFAAIAKKIEEYMKEKFN